MKIENYGTVPQLINAYMTKLQVRDAQRFEEKKRIAKMSKEEAERQGLTAPKGKKMRKRKHLV